MCEKAYVAQNKALMAILNDFKTLEIIGDIA